MSYLAHLRDLLERELAALTPPPVIVSRRIDRVPQTSCAAFGGLNRQALAMALDQQGVACSTGSACASGSSRPSPVLQAMGLPDHLIQGALRFSVGRTTTEAEIMQAAAVIGRVVNSLR
jgi:cysteine desulfurase